MQRNKPTGNAFLAGDQPVEQHADGRQVLLDGRLLKMLAGPVRQLKTDFSILRWPVGEDPMATRRRTRKPTTKELAAAYRKPGAGQEAVVVPVFAIEGPMTDDRPWKEAARHARNRQRRIVCGPTGTDRDALAAEYQRAHMLAGVPPGSIMRPRP